MPKDTLDTYRAKRDFTKTAEPSGKPKRSKGGDSFVVQKHAARRLHYDFRLELDGVLKSWAVTRGPSYNPRDKRLAVRTEDHPLDYGGFEGTIPEGEYGAGSVIIWDNGRWEPRGDPHEGLERGNLKFDLYGQRLHGSWALVRMKADREGKARENWLLIKERDEFARDDAGESLLEQFSTSVVSGHTIDDIAGGGYEPKPAKARKSGAAAAKPRGGEQPGFVDPQLTELHDTPPEGAGWFHEIKYDGYRIVAVKDGGKVRFFSRSGLDWTAKFASLTPTIAALPCDSAVIDGEVAVVGANNLTDFSALQQALSEGRDGFTYYVFDLLHLDGRSLRDLPLRERKARLQSLTAGAGGRQLVYSDHVEGRGDAFYAQAAEMGLEGMISKDAASLYRSGRSSAWRKIKVQTTQEFVIVGYSKSDKKARPFSSLLLGYHDSDGRLTYAGRVGTGYTEETLHTVAKRMEPLLLTRRPKIAALVHKSDAVYIKPELVAQISFRGWTADNVVRHAVFKGLRMDKRARDVTKEEAAPMPSKADAEGGVRLGGVRLTNPDRMLYPEQGVSKRQVAEYYLRIADRMMPYIGGRLISLVRCPQGSEQTCFFQRHASAGFPEQFKGLRIKENNSDNEEEYIYIEDAGGLVAAAQIGALELHIWGSHVDNVERADRIVFDLDPDEELKFSELKKAAIEVKDMLAGIGLETFVMATGGKGLHIVAPVEPQYEWPEVKAFCRAIAETLAAQHPDRYTANIRKATRKGRIFVDYLRNDRTSTAICPYSTRNKQGASIAVPLTWDALKSLKSAHPVTIQDAAAIDRLVSADPWEGYFEVKQKLPIEQLLQGKAPAATPKKRKRR